MVLYTVRAITSEGAIRTVRQEARSEEDLEGRLASSGMTIARVVCANDHTRKRTSRLRVDRRALADFTERMQILYAAGIPLVEALREIEESSPSESLRAISAEMRVGIEGGQPLSETMVHFPDAFPPTYVAAIRAAEKSGALDDVLLRLTQQIEWERATLGTVKQAMIYPAILCGAVLTLLSFLFTYLLPKIAGFFQSSRSDLPLPTQVVLSISDLLSEYGLAALGGFVGTIFAIALLRKTGAGRAALDRFALRLPILGTVLRKLACARFVATLRMLHHAGAPMMDALTAAKDATGNAGMARDLNGVVERIRDGGTLTDSLATVRDFDSIVTRMIRVGESSGALSEALEHATAMLDKDVQRRTKTMLAFIEPLLLIFSGIVVGFVVFATLMPIFRMLGGPK